MRVSNDSYASDPILRYGIRVDPIQWLAVLGGRGEGSHWPALLLLACNYDHWLALR